MSKAQFWPRELALGLTALLVGTNLLISVVYLPMGLSGFADFRQLYAGGYMIRSGLAHDLYNYDAQQAVEQRLVPMSEGRHFLLPITHPAFEELLFVPFSRLPYRLAFWAFLVVNLALTTLCLKLLQRRARTLGQVWRFFPLCVVAGFFPVWRTLLQGQDSILLLTLLLCAMLLLDGGRSLIAGLVLGIGVFKFNIVLPMALLFTIWKRWQLTLGFAASSLGASALTLLLVGWKGVHDYAAMLSAMSVNLTSPDNVVRYATITREMLNLRGLLSAVLERHTSATWTQTVVLIASLGVLLLAARRRPSFSLAILAASLVSYNFVAHDAAVLIIPIMAALEGEHVGAAVAAVAMLLAPLAAIIPRYGFLGAMPTLALFLVYACGGYGSQNQLAGAAPRLD